MKTVGSIVDKLNRQRIRLVKEAADLDARVREQRVTLERELESNAA